MSDQPARHSGARFAPEEPVAERLVHMLVAMATELAATHERVDTLERLLNDAGVLPPGAADSFNADADAQATRKAWRERFLDRLFEHLQDEIEELHRQGFTNTAVLWEGIQGWVSLGYPVTVGQSIVSE